MMTMWNRPTSGHCRLPERAAPTLFRRLRRAATTEKVERSVGDVVGTELRTVAPQRAGRSVSDESSRVATLQHAVGNRGMADLFGGVQRQPVDEPGAGAVDTAEPAIDTAGQGPVDLLDAAQVVEARRYYAAQPWRYTPSIIEQMRTALDLPSAGGLDDALIQAAGRFQSASSSPELTVDGKIGPRTLPRLFRHGLDEAGEGEAFGEQVQTGVIDEWATLATPEARRDALVGLVNQPLVAHGSIAVSPGWDPDTNNSGSFHFSTWEMRIGRNALTPPTLSEDEAKEIADTLYHEARHSEQWYRMAQLRAGQHLSARAITAELGIPSTVAAAAFADPLDPASVQGLIAQGWWDSVYGAGSAHRDAVLTEVSSSDTAMNAAQKRNEEHPSPANQAAFDAARARFLRAHHIYTELPEENDAWTTGPAAAEGISSGTPAPAPAPGAAPAPAAAPEPDDVAPVRAATPEGGDELIDEPAGAPPAAGASSHEILPDENLP